VHKRIVIAALTLIVALPALASAKDMTGRFGLGYFTDNAPIGVRYWFSPRVGLDVGFGFSSVDGVPAVPATMPPSTESAIDFTIEAGVPYIVHSSERANLFLRAGGLLSITDDRLRGGTTDETWTTFDILLGPGAEVFFGDHFSLEASHGIRINIDSPPVGDSQTSFGTVSGSISELGFHYYF
jgi:hypothetical protein